MKNKFYQINKNINFYNKNIRSIIPLSKEEEYTLAKKFKEKNNLEAAKKLVESNLYYVIKIARSYDGYKLIFRDLIQEGIIGLIKAIKKFNPNKKIRLISFAIFWIKSEMHEYIIKNFNIIKLINTKSQRKIFFNLKKIKNLKWLTEKEIITISNLLNVKKNDIKQIEYKLYKNDTTIENKDNKQNEIKYVYLNNMMDDPMNLLEKANWTTNISNNIKNAINKLDDRSKLILIKRWLNLNSKNKTLKQLSKNQDVSLERIRQLENNAIINLKNFIDSEN